MLSVATLLLTDMPINKLQFNPAVRNKIPQADLLGECIYIQAESWVRNKLVPRQNIFLCYLIEILYAAGRESLLNQQMYSTLSQPVIVSIMCTIASYV